jgi:hypothetical protein
MRRTLLPLLFLVAPAALAAQAPQDMNARRDELAIQMLSETRRLPLLPNETVGFRVLGENGQHRTIRFTTGHLINGRLYRAVATVLPGDGSPALRTEGTLSVDTPNLDIGALPAGSYYIKVHLEDMATGATRDARNNVVLH